MSYLLRSARFLAAEVLQSAVSPGDTVVDATMGNGHDTLTLCHLVGPEGTVIAFDVQESAVENTRARLYCLGHERMLEKVAGPVAAVAFNLGWLPGGNKAVTTHWETTKIAVESALSLLRPLGVAVICAYPGHAEGDREREALVSLLANLPLQQYNVLRQKFLNAGPGAPECFVIQRQ